MKYNKKVLCLKSNNEKLWTNGVAYDAVKHQDGSWDIKTNLNEVTVHGILDGGWVVRGSFSELFSDVTKGATLLDAVRLAYTNGYFTITDKTGQGCRGIHCETPSGGFYFGGKAADEAKSAKDYLASVGEFAACQGIAKAITDMAECDLLCDDAAMYLREMKDFCTVNGNCAVEGAIDEWLSKTERECERDN